ncbi:MAG TPA: NAD(P)-dependent oxidoreductase [Euzebyales bacterium]|nr:NAD(P)-dependent oxidoreductase [Euzebyales bacterium]
MIDSTAGGPGDLTVGMVGLGIMGSAMAGNLLADGFDVVGYDPVAEKVRAFADAGGRPAGSEREVAAGAEVVLISVASVAALQAVVRPDGLPAGAHDALVVAETGTMPLAVKEQARDALAGVGVPLLDCTLSGTGAQAARRDLVVYGSGDRDAFERARVVFDVIARSVHHLGEFGMGSKMKYIANLLVSIHNLSTAEAFVLARKAGLDLEQMFEVISDGVGSSRVFDVRGPMMVEGRYSPPQATVRMFMKDVAVIGEYAAQVGAPTPLFSAAAAYYNAAMGQGLAEEDPAALCAVLEGMAGAPRDDREIGT